jgi:hypothetical protein
MYQCRCRKRVPGITEPTVRRGLTVVLRESPKWRYSCLRPVALACAEWRHHGGFPNAVLLQCGDSAGNHGDKRSPG